MKPLIGILAGMGPRSTAPFIDMVVDECQRQYRARDDADFPPMMIYSLPTPFYLDRPIDHGAMKRAIAGGLQKLASAGADFIAMPCNTAHAYFSELRQAIDIPLLNIIEETVGNLADKAQKTTLFATASTFDTALYQKAILEKGHDFVFRDQWQERINTLIQTIKADTDHAEAIAIWRGLITDTYRESVDHIVIACTDLNVVLSEEAPELPAIDSSRCLAEAVVKKYMHLLNQ